ncbi:MAG: hypothetical protein ACQ9IQ_01995 [Nitrospirales bacterium]
MSSLLPIFVNAQKGPHAIDGGGAASESLSLVNKDQSTSSGQALAPAFYQVLREFNRTTAEKILGDLQPSKIQASPEDILPSTTDSPLSLPSAVVAPFDGFQPPARTLFQGSGFQQAGGDSTLGTVKQESEIGGRILGIGQIPLPKALEAGSILHQDSVLKVAESKLIPQHIPQGSVIKQASLALKQEDALSVRTVVPSAKEVPSGFQQVGRLVPGNETLQTPILPKVSSPLAPPKNVQSNHMSPATAIQAEGPAGFTGPNLTNQILVKSTPGNSSLLSDVAGPGIEHRTTVPAELLGGAEVLAKGERGQTIIETLVKTVGLDPSGGQGLGNGMNHFSNSQSGSQQPSSFPGQGVGLRGLEERGQEFPAPALQRLQMDVQLSENQRVHIDVGVHNRQVYTGLVMDHSVLRNLATQFIPQLENQLAEVDLELQEFSAEVREEPEQEAGSLFDDSRSHKGQESGRRAQGDLSLSLNPLLGHDERGLHFVA